MTYAVLIKPSARRELEALPDGVLRRVDRLITGLSDESRPKGSLKLQGTDLYRVAGAPLAPVFR